MSELSAARPETTGPAPSSDATGPAVLSKATGPAFSSEATGPAVLSEATGPAPSSEATGLYGSGGGGGAPARRVTVRDIAAAKARGERWPMLTAYDNLVAGVLDAAGIPVLLVGDSAANVVYGYETTVPVTVDELLPLVRAVVRGARRAMVVADLPFGSYQASPALALATATRFLKEGGAHAVKLEGGARVAAQVELLVESGVPVMAHLGLTPQSVHVFGGHRVQGRGEAGEQLLADAKTLQTAGAFAVVLEAVPAELASRVTASLAIPTIGIGAGAGTDAQVLLWQDMAGLTAAGGPKFVKRYADVRTVLADAARAFADEVTSGAFPDAAHSYR
jgi:3-methyl-2-oxobutanoate hydroxymethyltransferase